MILNGSFNPKIGDNNVIPIVAMLTVNWKIMNFWIDFVIVLPYNTAFSIEVKLLFKITISEASLATSVPSPIEKPTSAALRAGLSLIPSVR